MLGTLTNGRPRRRETAREDVVFEGLAEEGRSRRCLTEIRSDRPVSEDGDASPRRQPLCRERGPRRHPFTRQNTRRFTFLELAADDV